MSWFPHFYAPRKRAATIHTVYIADGVADDCEELIHRCCQAGTLNFNIFSNIWKDMKFAWIFQSRQSGAEIAELSEEVLQVAKRYLILNTTNFEETVASLFLIYAVLHLQPIEGFASLRILPEDMEAVFRIQATARQQKRHDVLYILASVLVKGPCQFHAGEREYGMDVGVRKYFDSVTTIDKYGTRPKGVFYRQNEELDLLRELSSLGRRYARSKIFNNNVVPDRTLRYADEHLPNELAASLKQLIDGDTTGIKSQAATVQSIKERAMWHQIQEMRHLKQLPERSSRNRRRGERSGSPVARSRNNRRRKNSTTKSGSPNKTSLHSQSKKRVFKQPYNYKSKSVVSTSSSGESTDISMSSSSDNDDFDTNDDSTADEADSEAEVHLNNLKTIDEYLNRIKNLPQTVTSDNGEASTSEIQYEIEIIDYMQDGNTNKTGSDITDTTSEIKDMNNIVNKNEKIDTTKTKSIKKSLNMTDGSKNDTHRDKTKEKETELKTYKPAYTCVPRKITDQTSPLGKGPKGRVKATKCVPPVNLEDTSSIDLPPPKNNTFKSLPDLVVVEIQDEVEAGSSAEVVEEVVEKRASKRKAVVKSTPKKAAAKKGTPKKAAAKKGTPKKAAAKKCTPKKNAVEKGSPKKKVIKRRTPKKRVVKKRTPIQKAVAKRAQRKRTKPNYF